MTAMVDAMIFIVIIGLAVTAMFSFSGNEPAVNDASSITENIFSAKLRVCDLIDSEESGLAGVPDMVAVFILSGEGTVIDYIRNILDSLMNRDGSYLMEIEYNGRTVSVGAGRGEPVSSSVKEFTVTYGGSIRTSLTLY
jgi:hypothetical protein